MSFPGFRPSLFFLLFVTGTFVAETARAEELTLPEVSVHAQRMPHGVFRSESSTVSFPATVDIIDLGKMPDGGMDRSEDVFKFAGIGSTSTNAGGLGTGINLRGFDVGSRLFVNGHPDIQRLYARDLATVDVIEILKGHSSVLYGQAAPGGTVNYVLHKPTGILQSEASLSVDNYGLRRLVVDHDQPLGDSAIRVIYAGQTGNTFIEPIDNRRQSLMLSGRHRYNGGGISAEVEYQRNERPFGFGTVFAGGRYWYDRYYIAPASRALREYQRQALYWDHELANGWSINAALNFAQVKRNETLAGFWTITSATTLSSYYRELTDNVDQNNFRIELRGSHTLGGMKNDTIVGYQQDRQRINFSGPQNIAGYSIDIANPNLNLNWDALPLPARVSRERYNESGVFWFNQLQATDRIRVIAGLRESAIKIETGNATTTSTAADIRHLSSVGGVAWQPVPQLALHLTRSESFEPNRGTTRSGGFLQPRQGNQWETGIRYEGRRWDMKLAVFDLQQSNLTAADPLDKNALVTIGTIRVQGIETAARWDHGALSWDANMGWQRAWNGAKTSSSLGNRIVNVPSVYGAIRLHWRVSSNWLLWGAVAGVGQRAGDPKNTFTAPGYATLSAGARYRIDLKTSLALEAGNLADKRYVEALSAADSVYQGERRRISATVRHQF
ncbi:MAG: TonB-dependent receptor [Glaciimonas sp.]|nr:TonB-dependent receptor [Glaciimonas sp.]